MAKKTRKDHEFQYASSTKWSLIAVTVALVALIPLTIVDKVAWVGGFPLIAAVLVPIVLAFLWIIWQDTTQRITVTKESITAVTGAGHWRKVVEIQWNDIRELRDCANVFSNTRKYDIVSDADASQKIRINSSYDRYRELLKIVINRLPSAKINERAKKSLKRMRVM